MPLGNGISERTEWNRDLGRDYNADCITGGILNFIYCSFKLNLCLCQHAIAWKGADWKNQVFGLEILHLPQRTCERAWAVVLKLGDASHRVNKRSNG